ncbi:hypothetical protein PPERSA_04319 [Pseudocohnilembus persalinus]|uniref:Uncharacterized protein n=1 Tax=Pseudocohnilembus persalinus TaxID=266149 RepID=A0A0V0QR67_PSEPJ|nr:hypothetical protein PPERSA_04319 [Pseudocohnilembus persalinus]|eukprot:KRX04504.1 hypothetical protein PPERSA_04319 [Pseudocohnilembus persalinus]
MVNNNGKKDDSVLQQYPKQSNTNFVNIQQLISQRNITINNIQKNNELLDKINQKSSSNKYFQKNQNQNFSHKKIQPIKIDFYGNENPLQRQNRCQTIQNDNQISENNYYNQISETKYNQNNNNFKQKNQDNEQNIPVSKPYRSYSNQTASQSKLQLQQYQQTPNKYQFAKNGSYMQNCFQTSQKKQQQQNQTNNNQQQTQNQNQNQKQNQNQFLTYSSSKKSIIQKDDLLTQSILKSGKVKIINPYKTSEKKKSIRSYTTNDNNSNYKYNSSNFNINHLSNENQMEENLDQCKQQQQNYQQLFQQQSNGFNKQDQMNDNNVKNLKHVAKSINFTSSKKPQSQNQINLSEAKKQPENKSLIQQLFRKNLQNVLECQKAAEQQNANINNNNCQFASFQKEQQKQKQNLNNFMQNQKNQIPNIDLDKIDISEIQQNNQSLHQIDSQRVNNILSNNDSILNNELNNYFESNNKDNYSNNNKFIQKKSNKNENFQDSMQILKQLNLKDKQKQNQQYSQKQFQQQQNDFQNPQQLKNDNIFDLQNYDKENQQSGFNFNNICTQNNLNHMKDNKIYKQKFQKKRYQQNLFN